MTNKDRAEQLIGVSVLEDDIRYDLLASNSDMYYGASSLYFYE